jgi:uncharacterized membrane protein
MLSSLVRRLSPHRYRYGVIALLAAASAVCISLVTARVVYSHTRGYLGLVWNLFLAWIPFGLAYIAYVLSGRRVLTYLAIPAFMLLWLIFFPNAPYILTDLQHLGQAAANVPVWYDVILLVWFSWTGMLLGVVSLNWMHEIVKREFGRGAGWVFVLAVASLSSVGVYIGRFIGLNSWDLFQNPDQTVTNLWDWLSDPSVRSFGFVGLYSLFFIFVYLTLYAFGHVLQEQRGQDA